MLPGLLSAASSTLIWQINLSILLLTQLISSKLKISQSICIWLRSCTWFIVYQVILDLSKGLCLTMDAEILICLKIWRIVIFLHVTYRLNMKKLKSILNSSSLMPAIGTKWFKMKEGSLIKNVTRSSKWKKKCAMVLTKASSLLMKKESIRFASKDSPKKEWWL